MRIKYFKIVVCSSSTGSVELNDSGTRFFNGGLHFGMRTCKICQSLVAVNPLSAGGI